MIFDRMTLLRALFPSRMAAAEVVGRWVAAQEREPELARDVIRIGRVLARAPVRYIAGIEAPDPIDPIRLAKAEGRREMALDLLAMMQITAAELRDLMENDDV